MSQTLNELFPHLCLYLKDRGYNVGIVTRPTHPAAILWNRKPYKCLLPLFDSLMNFAKIKDDEIQLHSTAFIYMYTKVLDAITLRPPKGLLGKSNNAKLGVGHDRKIIPRITKQLNAIKKIELEKPDLEWFGESANKYRQQLNNLELALAAYKNELEKLEAIVEDELRHHKKKILHEGFEASAWLMFEFHENQSEFERFLAATMADLRLHKVRLVNTKAFKRENYVRNIRFQKRLDMWQNEQD